MSATTFNRMRRLAALRGIKPEPGKNLRETISDHLKEANVPHSRADATSLARHARAGMARQTDKASVEPGVAPPGSVLTTGEIALSEVKDGTKPLASVVLDEGRVVDTQVDSESLVDVSAEHFAPPSSIHSGTDGTPRDDSAERMAEERRRQEAEKERKRLDAQSRAAARERERRRDGQTVTTATEAQRRATRTRARKTEQ